MTTAERELNVEQLRNKMKEMGIPGPAIAAAAERVRNSTGEFFALFHPTVLENQKARIILGFHRRGKEDAYHLNSMGLFLEKNQHNIIQHNLFFLPPQIELSVRNAYNLMQGRSVLRLSGEDGKERYWMTLDPAKKDLAQYFNRWAKGIVVPDFKKSALDVGKSLDELPFTRHWSKEEKIRITDSLEKGNLHPVWGVLDGKRQMVYLDANPLKGVIEIRNSRRELVRADNLQRQWVREDGVRSIGIRRSK